MRVTASGGIMLANEVKAVHCTKCGSKLSDGGQCKQCDGQNRNALAPAFRVRSNQIPGVVGSQLTKIQSEGLAFGAKNLVVKSAVIQSFNLGSSSTGTVKLAGVGRSFGPWAVFGAMGSINQTSVNAYRTDVQIKVEDESGQKGFLNYSLPFAITLAIEPGESLRVYFVRGDLQSPTAGDFRLDVWIPFVAESTDTSQLVPIAGVPTLGSPKGSLLKTATVAVFVTVLAIAFGASSGFVIFSSLVTIAFIAGSVRIVRNYKLSLAEATRRAVASAV